MSTSKIRVLQIVTGILWVIFGLNGFLRFIAMPQPPAAVHAVLSALAGSGYFFPMVKSCEILAGLGLLTDKFTNFSLVLLAPILVNIVALHVFLDPPGLLMGLILSIAHIILVHSRWKELKVIFKL